MNPTIQGGTQSRHSSGVHRLAVSTVWATGLLLVIGGLVTSKGVGLAVPDWPTTFGYNMFLYPWSKMVGGVFYEHSHRLVASGVGLLTLIFAVMLWIREPRKWVRWLGTVAIALVVLQGVLGGLRVVLLEQALAMIHGSVAQVFFALMVSLALFSSREWDERPKGIQLPGAGRLRRLCLLTTVFIYLQGMLGAVLRFTGSFLEAHLLLAFLVAVHVLLVIFRVQRFGPDQRKFVGPALLLGGLLILQLALGLGSYLGKFAPLGLVLTPGAVVGLTTVHMVVGALMLATSLVLTLRCYWYLTLSEPQLSQAFLSAHAEGRSEQVSA
jgi:cytochrome c oxidase assembly protein subunit 15